MLFSLLHIFLIFHESVSSKSLHIFIKSIISLITTFSLKIISWVNYFANIIFKKFLNFLFSYLCWTTIMSFNWCELRSRMRSNINYRLTTWYLMRGILLIHILRLKVLRISIIISSHLFHSCNSIWDISFWAAPNDNFWALTFEMIKVLIKVCIRSVWRKDTRLWEMICLISILLSCYVYFPITSCAIWNAPSNR